MTLRQHTHHATPMRYEFLYRSKAKSKQQDTRALILDGNYDLLGDFITRL